MGRMARVFVVGSLSLSLTVPVVFHIVYSKTITENMHLQGFSSLENVDSPRTCLLIRMAELSENRCFLKGGKALLLS